MVKMTVKLLDAGTERVYIESEKAAERALRAMFPEETQFAHRFLEVVAAVNEGGFAEVEVEPYIEDDRASFLPEGFVTHDQGDDPWPRRH